MKAGLDTRRDLLAELGADEGTVTVGRRRADGGDVLVVRMVSPSAVPPERRVTQYRGFAVEYETQPPVRAGRW